MIIFAATKVAAESKRREANGVVSLLGPGPFIRATSNKTMANQDHTQPAYRKGKIPEPKSSAQQGRSMRLWAIIARSSDGFL